MKNVTKPNKTRVVVLILLAVSVAMATIVVVQFLMLKGYFGEGSVVEGTSVNGVKLDGMKDDKAVMLLKEEFEKKADDFKLTLNSGNKSWDITRADFEVNSDIFAILEAAQEREKITDTYEKQKNLMQNLQKQGKSVNVAVNYVFVGLDKRIDEIIHEVEIEPVSSTITFDPNKKNMFDISQDSPGLRVDRNALYKAINDEFIKSNKITLDIPFVQELPEVTADYNKGLTHLVSEFSTNVADSTGGRKANVNLALSKFNGMVVNPGESVSFNKVTGPHSAEAGYKVATVIYNGQYVDGVGGGICQASSTLYNALVLAGMDVTEVHKHTLPVKYVPLALDAMVSEYVSDMKWTNNTKYPVFIKTWHDENSVHCAIYSHELEYEYKTRTELVTKLPSKGDVVKKDVKREYVDKVLFEGEYYRLSYPRDGYEAKAYLQTYKNGKLIDEKLIRHEIYQPQSGLVVEGIEKQVEGMNPINDVELIEPSSNFMNNDVYYTPTSLCP